MARYNTNRYEYETSPRKLQPEYTPINKKYPKKSTVRNTSNKIQTKQQDVKNINTKIILYIGIAFAILFAIRKFLLKSHDMVETPDGLVELSKKK